MEEGVREITSVMSYANTVVLFVDLTCEKTIAYCYY